MLKPFHENSVGDFRRNTNDWVLTNSEVGQAFFRKIYFHGQASPRHFYGQISSLMLTLFHVAYLMIFIFSVCGQFIVNYILPCHMSHASYFASVCVHYNAHALILKSVACFIIFLRAFRVYVSLTHKAESFVRIQRCVSIYLRCMSDKKVISREFFAWRLVKECLTKYMAEFEGNVRREYFELFVSRWYCVLVEMEYMTRFWVVNGRI